jgi:hypothetical protein
MLLCYLILCMRGNNQHVTQAQKSSQALRGAAKHLCCQEEAGETVTTLSKVLLCQGPWHRHPWDSYKVATCPEPIASARVLDFELFLAACLLVSIGLSCCFLEWEL